MQPLQPTGIPERPLQKRIIFTPLLTFWTKVRFLLGSSSEAEAACLEWPLRWPKEGACPHTRPPGLVLPQHHTWLSTPSHSPGPPRGRPGPSSAAYLMSALSCRSSRLRFRGMSSLSTTPE